MAIFAHDLDERRALAQDQVGTSSNTASLASPQGPAVVVDNQVTVLLEDEEEVVSAGVASRGGHGFAIPVSDEVAVLLEDILDTVGEHDEAGGTRGHAEEGELKAVVG